jgi:DNA-binding LacI/PurR family transcriptional regulator
MRTGSFGCVALLLSTRQFHSALPIGLMEGIHDGLAERNLHLTFARVPDEKLTDEQEVPKFLREWMADGMIVNYTHDFPVRLLTLINEHEMPSIWTNAKLDADCVRR